MSLASARLALLAGNFAIGCGVMVVPGSLNNLVESLQVSVAVAGQLITIGAVAMGCGAPLLALRQDSLGGVAAARAVSASAAAADATWPTARRRATPRAQDSARRVAASADESAPAPPDPAAGPGDKGAITAD
jgi:hypothetical protein